MPGTPRRPLLQTAALDETGRRGVLLGINDPAQAATVASVLPDAIDTLSGAGDVLVDLGRVTRLAETGRGGSWTSADQVLVVCRSTLVSVSATRHLMAHLLLPGRPARRWRPGGRWSWSGRDSLTRAARSLRPPAHPWSPSCRAIPTPRCVFSDGAAPRWRFTQSALVRTSRATAHDLHRRSRPPASPALNAGAADPAGRIAEVARG